MRVCNMPGSSAHRDFFFFEHVCAYQGNRGYPSSPQLGYWERGGGSHSQLQLHLFPSGTSTEKERGTHTNTVFLKAREGGMERDTIGSLLSLKGKACRKWNSCTDSVTMDQYSLSDFCARIEWEDGQFIHVVLIHLEWRNSWERCWATVGLERLDDLLFNFEGLKKWAEFKDQSGFYWKSLKRSTLKEKRSDQLNRSGPPQRRRVLAVPASSRWDEQWRLDICMGQKYVL